MTDTDAYEAARLGGFVPFSSVDWPGKLAAVVFVAGCPWRCGYCHNPHLQNREGHLAWMAIERYLQRRQGLLDGVVFSGGEPTVEPLLPELLQRSRALGFELALHTAGMYPDRLRQLLPQLDWVGLDIKSDVAGYDALTQRRHSAVPVQASLSALLASRVPFECRTTWHPSWLNESRLFALAQNLAEQGVTQFALQPARPSAWNVPDTVAIPSSHLLDALGRLFEHFEVRHGD